MNNGNLNIFENLRCYKCNVAINDDCDGVQCFSCKNMGLCNSCVRDDENMYIEDNEIHSHSFTIPNECMELSTCGKCKKIQC